MHANGQTTHDNPDFWREAGEDRQKTEKKKWL